MSAREPTAVEACRNWAGLCNHLCETCRRKWHARADRGATRTKPQMVWFIIEAARSAAIVEGKHYDIDDLFFTLAFLEEDALAAICAAIERGQP